MAILDKPLDEVTVQDLKALVTNQVAEWRTVDYKRDLPIGSEKDKVELRADASSFANAAGGHLLFGMDARKGVPVELCGAEVADADGEILRLESIIQAGVKPHIPGLATRALALSSDRQVIVMRIPRSWAGPHMVMNTTDWSRFYSRTSNGKYVLDIGEIRAAFLRSESFADRVRTFRADRLSRIVAGETPLPLPNGPKLVLHVVPFGAFDPGFRFDLAAPEQRTAIQASAHPIGAGTTSVRYNFDGLLRYGEDSYVQFFRNGCVEAVDAKTLRRPSGQRTIPSITYEHYLIVALRTYLAFERQLGVEPPLLAMLSLVGVRGYIMAVNPSSQFTSEQHPIDRDLLVVPEELIENYDREPEDVLKPSFDVVWNAADWPRSLNYDEQGHWKSPYRQN